MQLSFLIMWILVICESNAIYGNLLSLSLRFFLCIFMVLNAFLVSFQTSLESSFQHMWRAPHREGCSDFYELFASSISARDQKCLYWLICWKLLNLPSLRKTFIAFVSLYHFAALPHIFFKFLCLQCLNKCSPYIVFFLSRVFRFIYLRKNERVIGHVIQLQTCSVLLHLLRVGSLINEES